MGTVQDDVPPICFFVTSRLSASDFFEGLRVHDSPNGTEFWKNSSRLKEFPRKLRCIAEKLRKSQPCLAQTSALAKRAGISRDQALGLAVVHRRRT